jgi:hypothetical protein
VYSCSFSADMRLVVSGSTAPRPAAGGGSRRHGGKALVWANPSAPSPAPASSSPVRIRFVAAVLAVTGSVMVLWHFSEPLERAARGTERAARGTALWKQAAAVFRGFHRSVSGVEVIAAADAVCGGRAI